MTHRRAPRTRLTSPRTLTLAAAMILVACGGGDDGTRADPSPEVFENGPTPDPGGTPIDGDGETDFVSYLGENGGGGRSLAIDDAAPAAEGGTTATVDGGATGDAPTPARAISEADILKVEGDTLYALSRYSGLTVIDLSEPANLRVLGTYRSTATPFEMYLEGGTAYIMYNDFYHREWDEAAGGYLWQASSRMLALDVSDPGRPRELGHQDLPGSISDSRKVGDIVYVVTHQDTYCWECDAVANTRVSSFDVSDPAVFAPVDQERFDSPDETWGTRHVSVSQDRMYVSGYTWSSDGRPQAGSIQVVDISDPNGDIAPGAVVEIAGQIDNRWQMDEYDGVLRVISQPSSWSSLPAPEVETFAIESSTQLTPLGSLQMVLPARESLQSVRFDGARAFAVTFEQTDPLFTFDLTDPAHPQQVGEVEIPGFLYHMEPREDRLYALGFDSSFDGGALHVSIFDVRDLSRPTLLDRVNFGGDWASLAEDQDRVQKLFNLALDDELILLPYSGSAYDEDTCYYDWSSGIQLIDARGDDLTLRGVAPQVGEARRALLHDGVLFGVSDDAVQAFDIEDRDSPALLDRLDVAHYVSTIKVLGDELLRFGQNWWTDEVELDVVPLDDAEAAQSKTALDLASLASVRDQTCSRTDGTYYSSYTYFSGEVFVHGDYAFVPREVSEYGSGTNGTDYFSRETMLLTIVDLGGDAPRVVGELPLDPTGYDAKDSESSSYYAGFVQTDHALLVGRRTGYYSYDPATGTQSEATFAYDVIDLTAGADAEVVSRIEVPDSLARGGWGYGAPGCMIDMRWGWYGYDSGATAVSGDVVASQHSVPLPSDPTRARYYLDRLDVSDPAHPVLLEPVNIPGQVLRYDHTHGRLVTTEDVPETLADVRDADSCWNEGRGASWVYDEAALEASNYDYASVPGECVRWHRRLNSLVLQDGAARRVSLLDLESVDADGSLRTSGAIAVSDSRIFYQTHAWSDDGWSYSDPEVSSLGYGADGRLTALGSVASDADAWSLVARGNRAFLSGYGIFEVIDSPDDARPTTSEHELRAWYCNTGALEVAGDDAFCAGYQYGVQRIPLD